MSELLFDDYATVFAKFTTPYQQQAYEAISPLLHGRVLDAGCGCAKIAAYIPASTSVTSYLGVDSSDSMVREGQKLLANIRRPEYEIRNQKIEETNEKFDSIVSLQSYYAWLAPEAVLEHLYHQLHNGGTLVLASANNTLDIELLIRNCSRGWQLHPDWPRYVGYNRELAALPGGRFVSLDTMIGELRNCGFKIVDTDSSLFEKGVSMVVAAKPH